MENQKMIDGLVGWPQQTKLVNAAVFSKNIHLSLPRLSSLPLVSAAAGARPSAHDAPPRPPLPLSGRPKIAIQAGGKMGSRVFVLFIVGVSLLGSRILALDHTAVERTLNENTISLATKGSPQLCQLCEQFATEALFYLKENQTQIEIIDTLHHACLKFHSLKLECTKLVDYYAPLFFAQIASLSPEEFCVSASLCEEVTYIRLPGHEHACTLCHEVVDEIRTGLEDPEMELKIIEILLKGCNNTESFVQKCKRLIIQNAPVILEDIKKFLTRRDFCDSIRVCGGKIVHTGGVGPRGLSAA